jgi:hypothetical protein
MSTCDTSAGLSILRHPPAQHPRISSLSHRAMAQIGFQVLMVGLIMAGLFTGKRTGRSASWEHVRIGSSIL